MKSEKKLNPLVIKHSESLQQIVRETHRLMRRDLQLAQLADRTKAFAQSHYGHSPDAQKFVLESLQYIFEKRESAGFIFDVPRKLEELLATAPCLFTMLPGLTTKETLSYNDVVLAGRRSKVQSREWVTLDSHLTRAPSSVMRSPITVANMRSVISFEMAEALVARGLTPIFHRFKSPLNGDDVETVMPTVQAIDVARNEKLKWADHFREKAYFSCGVNQDTVEFSKQLMDRGAGGICVDVAIGNSDSAICTVLELAEYRRERGYSTQIIAGNVDSADGYLALALAGADAVKVGIGPGAACTTRLITGAGTGQASALMSVGTARFMLGENAPTFIADGGITGSKDILVALALGASSVMIGKLAAATKESGALKRINNSECFYFGEASKVARVLEAGEVKRGMAVEGRGGWIPCNNTIDRLLDELEGGLNNSLPYYDSSSIAMLQHKLSLPHQLCDLILNSSTGIHKAAAGMGQESSTRLR